MCDAVTTGRTWTVPRAAGTAFPVETVDARPSGLGTARGSTSFRPRITGRTMGRFVDAGATWVTACDHVRPTGSARGAATGGGAGWATGKTGAGAFVVFGSGSVGAAGADCAGWAA